MEFRREIVLVNQLSSSRKDIVPSAQKWGWSVLQIVGRAANPCRGSNDILTMPAACSCRACIYFTHAWQPSILASKDSFYQSPAILMRLMPLILPSALKPNRRWPHRPSGKRSCPATDHEAVGQFRPSRQASPSTGVPGANALKQLGAIT
jgi:hypothetical protein